jgi:hypothetical protein
MTASGPGKSTGSKATAASAVGGSLFIRSGEGVITGTVVCAAVIAASAGHVTTTAGLMAAIVGTVVVYWLAHLHAHAIGAAVAHGHHPIRAFEDALAHTWPIAAVSFFPLVILLVAELAGAALVTAAWISLWCTVALLGGYSYLAGRRGGLDRLGSLGCGAGGALLGILIALLKAALH